MDNLIKRLEQLLTAANLDATQRQCIVEAIAAIRLLEAQVTSLLVYDLEHGPADEDRSIV